MTILEVGTQVKRYEPYKFVRDKERIAFGTGIHAGIALIDDLGDPIPGSLRRTVDDAGDLDVLPSGYLRFTGSSRGGSVELRGDQTQARQETLRVTKEVIKRNAVVE